MMQGSDFVYYSTRCRKQRLMADASTHSRARAAHRKLAAAYADRAALAMLNSD
ncbi:hypothetical protein SAMN05518849_1011102 [Sphingobium sp. AP50]|jgi:pyridoxine/pyridoxamine 5'-phosphate oxidase|uniref:hypothetical protein n=1 Tax=unclassified Sphingobium TaxID=2611147 RepID=UPI0008CC5E54|nr:MULTISPECIES: hypothetical protein [unclassified Sphingobium]SEI84848.1 hypothetical protein SAMN05518849_1011102 [Sphingobium sp. AP50]SER60670.1 hypothetical protein SAMN05518866_114101 [Sphingobium sp. YR768]